jgi:hypothetical protein
MRHEQLSVSELTAGSVTASGTVQAEQLTSTDDASIADDLTVGGDVAVTGNYTSAAGNITLTAGDLSVGDDAAVGGDLTVTGNYTSAAGNITLTAGDLSVGDDAAVGGDLTVTGTILNTALSAVIVPYTVTTTPSVAAEAANVVAVAAQFTAGGSNIAYRFNGHFFLSDDSSGIGFAATGPDSVAAGAEGKVLLVVAKKLYAFQTNAAGLVNIDVTHAGAGTFYMVFVLPNGKQIVSGALTFAD